MAWRRFEKFKGNRVLRYGDRSQVVATSVFGHGALSDLKKGSSKSCRH